MNRFQNLSGLGANFRLETKIITSIATPDNYHINKSQAQIIPSEH